MSVSAPSQRAEFTGIGEYFDQEIAPYLQAKEKDRRAAVVNFALILAGLGALALSTAFFGPFGEANIHAAVILAMIASGVGAFILNRTRNDIAHGLLERLCAKFGFSYRARFDRPGYYPLFKSLRLLPSHNRETWEDEVSGEHAGCAFKLCETHLKYKSSGKNSSTRTVFHGQLFVIDYPKRFLGTTVVKRDRGVFNALAGPGKGFSRVGLASPEFEKAFEAWSTDQVEARDLLDPLVLERFQELERLYEGKQLRAAFVEGKAIVAIETGDRLNMGSMFTPLDNPRRVEQLLAAFDAVFDLIDVMVRRTDGKLAGAFSVEDVRGLSARE